MSEERSAQELVIIRRRSGHEEEHGSHGLWKIAYADFMTAMMAFFLVMWLVNAANKKTLASVATYFNPIRMSDQSTQKKGVQEVAAEAEPSEGEKDQQAKKKTDGAVTSEDAKDMEADEQGMFRDPYGVLTKLSEKATTFRRGEEAVPKGGSMNAISDVYNGGEGFRDPFDPAFRQEPRKADGIPSDPEVADGTASQAQAEAPPAAQGQPEDQAERAVVAAQPAPPAAQATADAMSQPTAPEQPAPKSEALKPASAAGPGEAKPGDGPVGAAALAEAQEAAATKAQAAALQTAIATMTAEAKTRIPDIEVTSSGEGILISVMDDADFGMFAIGSAKPKPELVAVMEKIAAMLRSQTQHIIVRGHTDGRPYRSGLYDNWRLSTARAHMAYYMLVKGGVAEATIDRVEGYADRNLKVPGEPGAASNRRIEILLKAAR